MTRCLSSRVPRKVSSSVLPLVHENLIHWFCSEWFRCHTISRTSLTLFFTSCLHGPGECKNVNASPIEKPRRLRRQTQTRGSQVHISAKTLDAESSLGWLGRCHPSRWDWEMTVGIQRANRGIPSWCTMLTACNNMKKLISVQYIDQYFYERNVL